MNQVTYPHVRLASLKKAWSSIRTALPVVCWPSPVKSEAVQAGPEAAGARDTAGPQAAPVAASAPPEAPSAADALTLAATHLEYLGYEIQLEADGWSFAQHPYRYNFHLRTVTQGIRLHCSVDIGAGRGNTRAAWLEFLNRANEHGHITRFSLSQDNSGRPVVRMSAHVSGVYSRKAFAMALEMWRDDLDVVRRKPAFVVETAVSEHDEVTVTVN
jgi:hypothetical protein